MADVERHAERVVVPSVVALNFAAGQQAAVEAGVVLTQRDPDGPPLAALIWPNNPVIVSQSPPAGAWVFRWDSVAVTVRDTSDDGPVGVREPRLPRLAPDGAAAAAVPPVEPASGAGVVGVSP